MKSFSTTVKAIPKYLQQAPLPISKSTKSKQLKTFKAQNKNSKFKEGLKNVRPYYNYLDEDNTDFLKS